MANAVFTNFALYLTVLCTFLNQICTKFGVNQMFVQCEELKCGDQFHIGPTNRDWARNATIVVKKVNNRKSFVLLILNGVDHRLKNYNSRKKCKYYPMILPLP